MCKKLIYLISFVMVLSLVSDVQAGPSMTWTDGTGDHDWFTPGNWNTGAIPIAADKPQLNVLPGATIGSAGAVSGLIFLGNAGSSALKVDGGTLTSGTLQLGQNLADVGTLNMISGAVTATSMWLGKNGTGILNMDGGTVTLGTGAGLWVGYSATAVGHVQLDGGLIDITCANSDALVFGKLGGTGGTIDITEGTMIIARDMVTAIEGWITDGRITAYGGTGTVLVDYDVTNSEKTTVSAIPEPATIALLGLGGLALLRRRKR